MKVIGAPTLNLKVTRTPQNERMKSLNGECNYFFLFGMIGLEDIGACGVEIGVPTQNWWNVQECPVMADLECFPPP